MSKKTGIQIDMLRFLRNLRKIYVSTQHCYTKFDKKKPKSPYSGALKTILKMVRVRDLKFCSVSRRSALNRQEKISSFRSIGKLVFWNPCFTIDCRDTYYIQCIYTVYTGGGGGGGK